MDAYEVNDDGASMVRAATHCFQVHNEPSLGLDGQALLSMTLSGSPGVVLQVRAILWGYPGRVRKIKRDMAEPLSQGQCHPNQHCAWLGPAP